MSQRIYLTFLAGEWRPVKELLKRRYPYLPTATAAKLILMELAESKGPATPEATRSHSKVLEGARSGSEPLEATTPSPARVREDQESTSYSSAKKKDQSKRKNKKKSSPALADIEDTEIILSDLNQRAGTGFRPNGRKVRELIAARMRDGATLDDFFVVNSKKAREWKGTKFAQYLRPSTLYGTKFDEYLGQAEQGDRQTHGPQTDGERRAERWARRKEPGYYERTE